MAAKDSLTMAREARMRRISEIEDVLARPESDWGTQEWQHQRERLQRELNRLREVQAHIATHTTEENAS